MGRVRIDRSTEKPTELYRAFRIFHRLEHQISTVCFQAEMALWDAHLGAQKHAATDAFTLAGTDLWQLALSENATFC